MNAPAVEAPPARAQEIGIIRPFENAESFLAHRGETRRISDNVLDIITGRKESVFTACPKCGITQVGIVWNDG